MKSSALGAGLFLLIDFEKSHFYHLAGLHYLKDLSDTLRGDRKIVFEKILDGTISQTELETSNIFTFLSEDKSSRKYF